MKTTAEVIVTGATFNFTEHGTSEANILVRILGWDFSQKLVLRGDMVTLIQKTIKAFVKEQLEEGATE